GGLIEGRRGAGGGARRVLGARKPAGKDGPPSRARRTQGLDEKARGGDRRAAPRRELAADLRLADPLPLPQPGAEADGSRRHGRGARRLRARGAARGPGVAPYPPAGPPPPRSPRRLPLPPPQSAP